MNYDIIKHITCAAFLALAFNTQAQGDDNLQTGAPSGNDVDLSQLVADGRASRGSASRSTAPSTPSSTNSRDRSTPTPSTNSNSSAKNSDRPTRPAPTPSADRHEKHRHAPSSSNTHRETEHHRRRHYHSGAVPPPPPADVVYVESTPYVASTYDEADEEYAINPHSLSVSLGFSITSRDIYSDFLTDESNVARGGYVGGLRYDFGPQFLDPVYMSIGVDYTKQKYENNFDAYNYMTNEKVMVEVPLHFGIRLGLANNVYIGAGLGPTFSFGLSGKCKETFDFRDDEHPEADFGTFTHDSYGGKYGVNKFRAGIDTELYLFISRVYIGYNLKIYPGDDCEPRDLYGELVNTFDCRLSQSLRIGYKIF